MKIKGSILLLFLLFGTAESSPARAQGERRAFVTSASGPADFSQWTESGGLNGVVGADAICQNLATSANLANPQNFVAWISDTSDDAYCRLHGLGGKKDSDCGQPSFPVNAGPWMRTDDFPFAEAVPFSLGSMGVIWSPLAADENGVILNDPPDGNFVFTASSSSGVLQNNSVRGTCDDWTSLSATPNQSVTGRAQSTTGLWSVTTQIQNFCQCDDDCHLYCFERLSGPPITAGGVGIREAFLSSAFGPGDFTLWTEATPGIADPLDAADSICQNLATSAGLESPTTFKAYLATSTQSADSRFQWDGPWWRTDGIRFTDNLAQLASGTATTTLHQNELGEYWNNRVWTGVGGPQCDDWQSASDTSTGRIGLSAESGTLNTMASTYSCDFNHRIYCLSDRPVPLVFMDGFETGDLTQWSAVQP